jgi:hypothetical protein
LFSSVREPLDEAPARCSWLRECFHAYLSMSNRRVRETDQ